MRKKKRPNFGELNISDSQKTKLLDFFRKGYNLNKIYYERIKYYCYKLNEFIYSDDTKNFNDYYVNFVDTFTEVCKFDAEFTIFDITNLNNTTLNEIRDFALVRLSTVESCLSVIDTEQRKIDSKVFPETIKNPENDEEYQKKLEQIKERRDLMIKAYNNKENLEEFDK